MDPLVLLLIADISNLLTGSGIEGTSLGLHILTLILSLLSGLAIGVSLGLIGGGGSIIAVPLLLYVVGMKDVHVAIGTSALAVGILAAINFYACNRKSNVNLKIGLSFALPGAVGAYLGAQLGAVTLSNHLLILFAGLMVAIGGKMLVDSMKGPRQRNRLEVDNNANFIGTALSSISANGKQNYSLIFSLGFAVGFAAGFFGIGGGFLIVPTLLYSTDLVMAHVVGTSLVPVSMFGLTAASSYLVSGQVQFVIATILVASGSIGGLIGIKYSAKIKSHLLTRIFALVVITVGLYISYVGLA